MLAQILNISGPVALAGARHYFFNRGQDVLAQTIVDLVTGYFMTQGAQFLISEYIDGERSATSSLKSSVNITTTLLGTNLAVMQVVSWTKVLPLWARAAVTGVAGTILFLCGKKEKVASQGASYCKLGCDEVPYHDFFSSGPMIGGYAMLGTAVGFIAKRVFFKL